MLHANRVNRVIGSLNAYIMSKREREMMLLLIIETDKSCIMDVCTCSIDSCINRADTIIINQLILKTVIRAS